MTPEQILEALKHLNEAWYRAPRGSDIEKRYVEQIEFFLKIQRATATMLITKVDE